MCIYWVGYDDFEPSCYILINSERFSYPSSQAHGFFGMRTFKNLLCQLFWIIQYNAINYNHSFCSRTPTDNPPTLLWLCIHCPPEFLVTRIPLSILLGQILQVSYSNNYANATDIYKESKPSQLLLVGGDVISSYFKRNLMPYVYIFNLCKSRKYMTFQKLESMNTLQTVP